MDTNKVTIWTYTVVVQLFFVQVKVQTTCIYSGLLDYFILKVILPNNTLSVF